MYKILYHKLVIEYDLKKLHKAESRKIISDIKKKLTIAPESFGKPLSGELKGYFRLRIRHFRIIYMIKRDRIEVLIIKVGLRKDLLAYVEASKRLKHLLNPM